MHHESRPFPRDRHGSNPSGSNPNQRQPNAHPPSERQANERRFSALVLLGSLMAVLSGCESFSCQGERACQGEGGAGASARAEEETRADAGLGGAPSESGAPRGCPAGYRVTSPGEGRCVDVDECAEGTHTCSTAPPVSCTNRSGGFICGPCPVGYSGSGETPDGCLLTAPSVSGVSPGIGARGVAVDAPLVVTFSEPMNPAATVAAFSSSHPSLASPTFAWNAERTELTVTPSAPYPIAEVTSASEPAESVTFTLGVGAEDAEGEQMLEPLAGSFSAHKRVTETLLVEAATSGGVRVTSGVYSAGNRSATNQDYVSRALLNYDLSKVPARASVERATFATKTQGTVCSAASGGPGWQDGVQLTWARVSYPARDITTATNAELRDMYSTPALQTITRTVKESDTVGAAWAYVDLDATAGVRRFLDDRSEPAERLNYRVAASYSAGCWWMTVASADLTLVYLSE